MDNNFYLQKLNQVNFSGQDLSGSYFARATLQECDFTGADLRRADFTGVSVEDFLSCTFKNALLTKVLIDSAVLDDYRLNDIMKDARGLQSFIIVVNRSEKYEVIALDSDNAIQLAKDSEGFDPNDWDDFDVEADWDDFDDKIKRLTTPLKLLNKNKVIKELEPFTISATKSERHRIMALNCDNAIQAAKASSDFDLSDWDNYEVELGAEQWV